MDNRYDTHCFGENFQPISLSSEECTVSKLLPEYTERVNIPICAGITVFPLDSGEVVIIDFGKGLWFVNRTEKSLINPHQCRSLG